MIAYAIINIALSLAAVAFIVINVYYLYIHRKYSHLPSPKGASYYRGHVPILSDRIKEGAYVMDTFKSWANECGPVFVVWILFSPYVAVAHPDIIKELGTIKHPKPHSKNFECLWRRQRFVGTSIITIESYEEWKDRRKTYDPSFSRRSLDDLIPQFNQVINKYLVKDLQDTIDSGKTVVDMKSVFSKVSLEVINWVAFGMDSEYVRKLCGSQDDLVSLMGLSLEGVNLQFNNPLLPYIKPFGGYKYTDAAAKLREIGRYCILNRIESIKNGEQDHHDILTQIITLTQKQGNINIDDLIDDFITFYVAGQETTSNTISFALVMLLQRPTLLESIPQSKKEQLLARYPTHEPMLFLKNCIIIDNDAGALTEIDEVIGNSTLIEKRHIDGLEYIQAIIEETMRLHPTASIFLKLTGEDVVTNDYRIPKNTKVMCSPYLIQHDPEYFANPLEFDPSRFEADQKRPSPYMYFPFGIGHRTCIGRTFAMMEIKIILALLLKNFKLTLAEGYVLKKKRAVTCKPVGEIPCTVTLRHKA